jgi:lysophospholipase
VLVCHGYFENMKRYRHIIERWNELGILVAIYDLRGHGESQGARGFISRFEEYVDDELDMLTELEKDDEWSALSPPVLFGHSTGGLVSILTALAAPNRLSGLALSSPYLGLAQEVPAVKLGAGSLLSRYLPGVSMPTGLTGADCTRTSDIAEAYDRDPMNFKKANVRWFTETVAAQKRAIEEAPRLRAPLYCLQGASDKVGSVAATQRFIDRVPGGIRQYTCLPGVYHEVLNEPERATFIDQFAQAMLSFRAGAQVRMEG